MNKKLIRLLSLALAGIMLFSLCSCDTTYEEEEKEIKYASEVPSGKAAIVERFNKVLADAKTQKPAAKFSLGQGTGGCECDNEYVKASFKTVANLITKEGFGVETKYGEDTKDVLPVRGTDKAGTLAVSDVRTAYITDNESDDTYTIIIKINSEENPEQDGSTFGKLFKIEKDEEILKNFENVKHLMTAESYNAKYTGGSIKAIIDKTSDHLVKLELRRDARIETEVTGHGTLESVGTVPLSFNYDSTEKYELDWDNPDTEAIED